MKFFGGLGPLTPRSINFPLLSDSFLSANYLEILNFLGASPPSAYTFLYCQILSSSQIFVRFQNFSGALPPKSSLNFRQTTLLPNLAFLADARLLRVFFASEASGPQKSQKYILRDLYASSLGKKTFLKVRLAPKAITDQSAKDEKR